MPATATKTRATKAPAARGAGGRKRLTGGHWLTTDEGRHVYVKNGEVIAGHIGGGTPPASKASRGRAVVAKADRAKAGAGARKTKAKDPAEVRAAARSRGGTRARAKGVTPTHRLAAAADKRWSRGQKQKAAGDHAAASKTFARHDALMVKAKAAHESKAKADTKPTPAPKHDTHTKPESAAVVARAVERTKARRDKLAASIKATRADAARGRAASVQDVKPDSIHFDPERFQYKLHADAGTGAVGSLAGVKKFDPELGGVLQVWKDPANGKTYVVNGHNRLDLAKRLGAETVSVRHVKAADAMEARSKGALTNIAEGRGTSTDAAEFFRTSKLTKSHLDAAGVPLREKVATEGLAISGLEEGLYRRHKAGDLPAQRAAIIGGSGLDHAAQAAIGKHLDKTRGVTDSHLKELVDNANASKTVKHTTHDLFGPNVEDVSMANHRAGVQAQIKDRLGKEKRVFGVVAKTGNAAELAKAGNVIDAKASGDVSKAAAENLAVFDTLKNRRGPVSDLLNEAAERIHKGEKAKAVHDEIYRRLPKAVQAALNGG